MATADNDYVYLRLHLISLGMPIGGCRLDLGRLEAGKKCPEAHIMG